MKFAEEFDQDRVPEWRDKYFDYKTGKRLVKAIQRAINRTNGVSDPRAFSGQFNSLLVSRRSQSDEDDETPLRPDAAEVGRRSDDTLMSGALGGRIARGSTPARDSEDNEQEAHLTLSNAPTDPLPRRVTFQIPDEDAQPVLHSRDDLRRSLRPLDIPTEPVADRMRATSDLAQKRATDTPKPGGLRRFSTEFSFARIATIKLENYTHPIELLSLREQELITFLDREFQKVDGFFRQKEAEAGKRLEAIREQLHIMRHRRNEELGARKDRSHDADQDKRSRRINLKAKLVRGPSGAQTLRTVPFTPIEAQPDSRSFERSDYARRAVRDTQISYRTAKRKLRVAVQEFHRELEYLKSYSLLNRMAFRKLNKKYERTIHPDARPTFRWFNENVEPSHFVNSDLVQDYIDAAEDLYTRYFERGNHKLAAGKLREITKAHGDKSGSALINGLLVGIGLVFAVEGVWDGIEKLHADDEELRVQTAFLLQIYAGYFLMLYLFTCFCICCRVWTAYKVNYPFVFEFDTRHDLDWKQLSNFPCLFWLLFGVAIWINFAQWWDFGREHLFLWYPVILVGVTLLIIFLPLPVLRWKSRKWFAIAHWRLLFSGLYPVEFRDLFLGDMYCSLIYAVANAELFFCLYATSWNDPRDCGSNNSRIMGALAALPPFWRALQCIRRFVDTRNAFPHLANLAKYVLTIGVAVVLAMYRIDNDWVEREIYIFLASISSLYTAFWDVFMDFSLLQEGAHHAGLRNVLAFDKPWLYYSIIVLDPVLRFGWIPLAVFTHDLQRGTVVAFIVAFAEATRRGMWILFRVENEHCSNIGHLKASRDVPLPYKILSRDDESEDEKSGAAGSSEQTSTKIKADTPLIEAGQAASKIKKAGLLVTISKTLAEAHRQDFQKKKRGPEDEMEEDPLHGSRRERKIERALQEDEESDGEMDEVWDDERTVVRTTEPETVFDQDGSVESTRMADR